jgi:large subunit ribosomal protein L9
LRLDKPIKTIGVHSVVIQLHPEVEVGVSVNVARSEDEATRQAAGEDLTAPEQDVFEFEEDDEEGEGEGEEADATEEAVAEEEA